jgi:putative flippase GtrA
MQTLLSPIQGSTTETGTPLVEVVVPVYNEQAALDPSVRRLHEFLSTSFPYRWRITIADNASTDATPLIARGLANALPDVEALQLTQKGRGRALKAAWSRSDADVVCYMDVDLSTDLKALLPLVAPLISGHSEIAIGSRLAPGAKVTRGRKREFISRSYNAILKTALHAKFSDAQCGFKAITRSAAQQLLPVTEDDAWFFDTELLVLAQRRGMRIHEVPVDWVDDPDSRVDIVRTAIDDLKGVARLRFQTSVARFLTIGVLSTIAYALLYLACRSPLGTAAANALALAITAVANTQANRRFTFGIRGREGLARQHAGGALVYAIALGLTGAALSLLHTIDHHPGALVEVLVLVTASAFATITRYIALKSWVFARRGRSLRTSRAPKPSRLQYG